MRKQNKLCALKMSNRTSGDTNKATKINTIQNRDQQSKIIVFSKYSVRNLSSKISVLYY